MKARVQKLVGLAALGLTLLTTPVLTWAGLSVLPRASPFTLTKWEARMPEAAWSGRATVSTPSSISGAGLLRPPCGPNVMPGPRLAPIYTVAVRMARSTTRSKP